MAPCSVLLASVIPQQRNPCSVLLAGINPLVCVLLATLYLHILHPPLIFYKIAISSPPSHDQSDQARPIKNLLPAMEISLS